MLNWLRTWESRVETFKKKLALPMPLAQRIKWRSLLKNEMNVSNVLVASYLADKLAIEYTVVKDIERRDALYSSVPAMVEKAKLRLQKLRESLDGEGDYTVGTPCLKKFWSEVHESDGKFFCDIPLGISSATEVDDAIAECIADVEHTLNAVVQRFGQHENLQLAFRVFEVGNLMQKWFATGSGATTTYGVTELTGAIRDAYDGASFVGCALDFAEVLIQCRPYWKEMSCLWEQGTRSLKMQGVEVTMYTLQKFRS